MYVQHGLGHHLLIQWGKAVPAPPRFFFMQACLAQLRDAPQQHSLLDLLTVGRCVSKRAH